MKSLLLFASLLIGGLSFSQDYHYKITIQDVDDVFSAKLATTVFRDLFESFPTFDDAIDTFDFVSLSNVNQTDLENKLILEGFVLLTFSKEIIDETQEIETE